MSPHRWLPWAGVAFFGAEIATAVLLGANVDLVGLAAVFYVLSTGLVGAVVASRVPGHPVGWLLLVASFCFATGGLLVTYVDIALVQRPGSLPISPLVVWLGDWSFGLGVGISATFLLLLFPTGHLPSPRWKPVAWVAGVGLGALLISVALSPDVFEDLPIDNPLANLDPLLLLLGGGGSYLLMTTVVASVASLVLRFRRSVGEQRQQLKWVAFAVVVIAVGLVGTVVWELANGPAEIHPDVENLITGISLSLLPVAIGVAILRYRLYDIDRLISRTVSYGILTAFLAGVYIGLVFLLRERLPVHGELAVAASTLAVAGLFNPIRRRVQAIVDRRFNRSRYNAAVVVGELAARLRNRVDLETVTTEVLGATGRALQPVSVSVWVKDSTS